MASQIQLRRDTAANWQSVNPTLAQGELGIETDTGKIKIGTGLAAWNSLSYFVGNIAGTTLDSIGDVTITSVQNGDFLRYNGSASVWINDPVNLATDTVGDYVSSLVAGTGVTLSNNSGEGATPTIAIGQAVSTSSSVTFAKVETTGDVTVGGNLTVNGTTTTLNTETLAVEDNIVVLNSGVTGTPTLNAGIEVERGDSPNVVLRWNETTEKWQTTEDGTNYYDIIDSYSIETRLNEYSFSQTVRLATYAVLPNSPTYTPGTLDADGGYGIGATLESSSNARLVVDGIQASNTNLILVKNQADATQNGIYEVTAQGSASAHWVLTRADNNNGTHPNEIHNGEFIDSQEGDKNAKQRFAVVSYGTGTSGAHIIGTDDIDFLQITGVYSFTAGDGLVVTDNTLNVATANAGRIVVSANSIDLAEIVQDDVSGSPSLAFISSIERDAYGRVLGVTTGDAQVTLGQNTTGNYVASLVAGTGITLANNSGETATPTISIGQDISSSASVTFVHVSADVTGDLIGNVTGDVTGNADTATTLETARTISLSGDVSGSVSFDGSADATITATIQPNSVALGTDTSGAYVDSLVAGTGVSITNNSGEGATPAIAIGQDVATSASVQFASVTAPLVGNASTATTLQTARNIAGQSFDGSANIDIQLQNLDGVNAGSPSEGNTLVFSSSYWTAGQLPLGTGTSGDYVASLVQGSGISITNNSGETATPTVSLNAELKNISDVSYANGTPVVYEIGDTGPAGGIIFITPSTSGNSTGKYFEAAPQSAEVSGTLQWAVSAYTSTAVSGADGTAIGTGQQNTTDIVAQGNTNPAVSGIAYADSYSYGGYTDWFIPSKDELAEFVANKELIDPARNWNDNSGSTYMYSSTEYNSSNAWIQGFTDGDESQSGWYKNYPFFSFRPVRAFTAPTNPNSGDFLKWNGTGWVNDAINLGTDTAGIYVATLVGGTGVTLSNNGGESASPTISIGQAVGTSSSVTFAHVSADVTGNVTGNVTGSSGSTTGNAATATTLETARTISLTGDVSGSVSFNGSQNVSISATVQPNSVALGTDTTGNYVNDITAGTGITVTHTPGEGSSPTVAVTANTYDAYGAAASAQSAAQSYADSAIAATNLDGLNNVTVPSPSSGDFLKWNGTAWVNDAINLGTDTTGDYVQSLVAGTGLTITNNSGESTTPSLAIGQDVSTSSSVVFAQVETTGSLIVGQNIYVSGSVVTENQVSLQIDDPFIYLASSGSAVNTDFGIAGNYNDGTYQHGGVFRDATDGKWKFFDSYVPEPVHPIDTSHASYAPAPVVAEYFESTVSTGTAPLVVSSTTEVTNLHADTATTLHSPRGISLGGDLSGSVSFDGSTDVTITATIQANSVALGTDTTGNYMSDVSAGTGISVSHTAGEGSTATVSLNAALDNLSDVSAAAPSDGQFLKYVSASSSWVPAAVPTINALDDIGNVVAPSPTDGEFLKYVSASSAWVPAAVPTINALDDIGDVSASSPSNGHFLIYSSSASAWISATANLDDLKDVDAASPSTGNLLKWNGSKWVPGTINLDDVNDVDVSTFSTNDLLQWNGTNWVASNTLVRPSIDNPNLGYSTTATSNGSTALDLTSNYRQFFTGTDNHTVVLPQLYVMMLGYTYEIHNDSTQSITVEAYGGGTVATLAAGETALITCTSTFAGTWAVDIIASASVSLALDDLSDVDAASPADGEFLKYVSASAAWVPAAVPTINALDDIGDVDAASPTTGEVLLWNGTAWVDSTVVRDNLVRFYMEVM